jgi:uncharacterized membrane protein YhaH (DUF805 family)
MSFGQWYVSRGRIPRRTFWLFYVLPLFVLSLLSLLADLALGNVDLSATATSDSASAAFQLGWVSTVVSLLTLVPSISSTVTRLHDRGHSAWWLLFGLIPLVGGILLIVQTGFLPGEPRPNRYGPPPPGQQVADPGYPQSYS